MATRQTRIFVPTAEPYSNSNLWWAETLLGRVIWPLVQSHSGEIDWFWFSRYEVSPEVDAGDCDTSKIPADFRVGDKFRSVRFRCQCSDRFVSGIEQEGAKRVADDGCAISGWLDYDCVADLGGNRFVGEDRSDRRRQERAGLVVSYLQSVSMLVIHALVGPDANGRYRPEENDDQLNSGSTFSSLHHMFCNITDVPLYVRVAVAPGGFPPVQQLAFKVRF